MRWRNALIVAGILFPSLAHAQSLKSVDELAWLAGRWSGTGLGGQAQEVWGPPAGGRMVGHFQLVKDGSASLYEFMMIDATPQGFRLRVKHFNPDFTAWEEKGGWHAFEPESARPNELRFKGLTMTRSGDRLTIVVKLRSKEGVVQDVPFHLRRHPG